MRKLIFCLLMLAVTQLSFAVSLPATAGGTEIPVYTEAKSAIAVSSDQPTFVIKLKSNPTTGFSWFLRDYNPTLVEPVKYEFEANTDKKLMGAPGYEIWTFQVKSAAFKVPQQTVIRLVYARPWETAETSMQQLFKVTTVNSK